MSEKKDAIIIIPVFSFSGRVLKKSKKREPIAGALVTVNKQFTKTDKNGFFEIKIQNKKSTKKNRFVLNIQHKDYGFYSKIYQKSVKNGVWYLTQSTTKKFNPREAITLTDSGTRSNCFGSLSSRVVWEQFPHRRRARLLNNQGQYIGEVSERVKKAIEYAENAKQCNPGISISIPPRALAVSEDEEVAVSLSTIDIFDLDSMPGDFTTRRICGSDGYMVTYGAGSINVTQNNKTCNLKKFRRATLTIPVNTFQSQHMKNRKRIPLLLYDRESGKWKKRGCAKFIKEKNAFEAKIRHFSEFNIDLEFSNPVCINIDSTAITLDNYYLEVLVPLNDEENLVKSKYIDNDTTQSHTVINLPPEKFVTFRAVIEEGVNYKPISDTVTMNSGPASATGCAGPVFLQEDGRFPEIDVLTANDETGTIKIKWKYAFPRKNDPSLVYYYDIKEEYYYEIRNEADILIDTIIEVENFIDIPTGNDITFDEVEDEAEYSITRKTGRYGYKVNAKIKDIGGTIIFETGYIEEYTYINVVSPVDLMICNELDGVADEWKKKNGIILVRVGITKENVCDFDRSEEILNPTVQSNGVINKESIDPNTPNRIHPNIPMFGVGVETLTNKISPLNHRNKDGTYWIYIRCGDDWEEFGNGMRYYASIHTEIHDCDSSTTLVPKEMPIKIPAKFGNQDDLIITNKVLPDNEFNGWSECPRDGCDVV